MRSTIIAAAASLLAAPAPAQSVDFTFPSDGSSFDVGSTISVTGTATGATTAGDLDLTVFIDTSFSTSLRPLAGEGDSRQLVDMVARLLERGVSEGAFRPGIDPVQLNITVAAVGYYYLTNRYTGSIIYARDLMAADALDDRLAFNIETITRLVCLPH